MTGKSRGNTDKSCKTNHWVEYEKTKKNIVLYTNNTRSTDQDFKSGSPRNIEYRNESAHLSDVICLFIQFTKPVIWLYLKDILELSTK